MPSLEKLQTEALQLHILDQYWRLLNLDFAGTQAARDERDLDNFFTRLEERFLTANVTSDEFKLLLTRRALKGSHLTLWAKFSNGNYETTRDAFIRATFPNSTIMATLLKELEKSTTQQSPSGENVSANEGTSSSRPQGGRRDLYAARTRLTAMQNLVARVGKRYKQEVPKEEIWINYALSLLSSPMLEEAKKLREDSASAPATAQELLAKLQPLEQRPSHVGRSRQNRRRSKMHKTQQAGTALPPTLGLGDLTK